MQRIKCLPDAEWSPFDCCRTQPKAIFQEEEEEEEEETDTEPLWKKAKLTQ